MAGLEAGVADDAAEFRLRWAVGVPAALYDVFAFFEAKRRRSLAGMTRVPRLPSLAVSMAECLTLRISAPARRATPRFARNAIEGSERILAFALGICARVKNGPAVSFLLANHPVCVIEDKAIHRADVVAPLPAEICESVVFDRDRRVIGSSEAGLQFRGKDGIITVPMLDSSIDKYRRLAALAELNLTPRCDTVRRPTHLIRVNGKLVCEEPVDSERSENQPKRDDKCPHLPSVSVAERESNESKRDNNRDGNREQPIT